MGYNPEISLRAVITGIDGAGKSTTASMVANDIGNRYRVVEPGPSHPIYSVIDGEKRYRFVRLVKSIDLLRRLADNSTKPVFIGLINSINVTLCGRIIEPSLIKRFKPDVVLGARDFYIDPAVYSIFYQPILAAKPMDKRIDYLGKITDIPVCNVFFFLTVQPEEAVTRIEARIANERKTPGVNYREKWRHMHENPDSLTRLQEEYYSAFESMQSKAPIQIFEINTNEMPQVKVADFIATIIEKHMINGKTQANNGWEKIDIGSV